MNRRQAAVVAGVHGLEHVERFLAADLADDDAVGPHTEGVDDELALTDGALPLDVGRPGFQADDVALPEHQLGGVFDRDHALPIGNEAREDVEERGLAGAGPPRHE